MRADKAVSRTLHDLLVQMLGIKPRAIDIKRIADAGIIDQIGIFLFDAGGAEIGDVDACVNACIRAAAAGHMHRMADDGSCRLFKRLSDGRDRLLHLPAVIGRAEIFKRQGNIAHTKLPYYQK